MSKEINGNAGIGFIAPINADKSLGIILDKSKNCAMFFAAGGSDEDYCFMLSEIISSMAKKLVEEYGDEKKVYEILARSMAFGMANSPLELEKVFDEREDDDE